MFILCVVAYLPTYLTYLLQIQTVSAIADNLESLGKADSAEYMRNELDSQIKYCMVDVMKACNHILIKKQGYFDLLGCDFMLSESNKLSLIEINTNPSLTLGEMS